jgi:hypothetical protein
MIWVSPISANDGIGKEGGTREGTQEGHTDGDSLFLLPSPQVLMQSAISGCKRTFKSNSNQWLFLRNVGVKGE